MPLTFDKIRKIKTMKKTFKTEVSQLLDLVINYQKKKCFSKQLTKIKKKKKKLGYKNEKRWK